MIKKSKNITFMFASFNAISIVTHLSINILLDSVETPFIQHCVYQIYQKIHFFNTVQNSRLRKNKIIHYVKTKQT